MKKLSMLLLVVMMAVIAAACSSGNGASSGAAPAVSPAASPASSPAANGELTFKHQLGEAKVKKNPKKVVAFDFGALDTLDKLGIEVTGVPQKNVPEYLAKYKDAKYQNVGSLQEPDYEKLSNIQPDVIFISGRQSAAYAELSKLAPTIYIGVDTKDYLNSFKTNMNMIGQMFSKEAAVDAELAKIDTTINSVKTKAANGKNGLVILANDGAISAYGPGSRFGIIHDVLGVPAVDKSIEVSTHGQSISFEYIAEKNPDYLFVVDRGAAVGGTASEAAKRIVENELVKETNAFKNNHIVYLDPGYWYLSGGGLISTGEMINQVDKGYNN
ncbi:siderophore ABC transporter substrate-binding protein [Paenibacillus sp. y28]|uniref:siderophore ABC transporter substrate-binding protein n=1 Tax=Paenibacillus sp. y28 TaxID=3129110 RepID=UPI00301B1C21